MVDHASSSHGENGDHQKAPLDAINDAVKIEDASPQIPESQPDVIPKVEHSEASVTQSDPVSKVEHNESDIAGSKPDVQPKVEHSEAAVTSMSDTPKHGEVESGKHYPGGERFDPSTLPTSDDAKQIRKQVEFYFSDSNLATDKYLFTMVSENAGWADLRSVANFKRMRRFQPFTTIVAALRESTELEVDETGEKIRRKTELKPFSASNSPVSRSVYVKGFPEETKTLQIDLEKFFESFGEPRVVRLRRTDDGKFKGSVFVEFATIEQHEAFLKLSDADTKPKYADKELEFMSKKAYLEMKEKEYGGKFPASHGKRSFNAFAKDSNRGRSNGSDRNRGRGRGRGRGNGRGGRDGDRHERNNDRNEEREESTRQSDVAESTQGEKRSHEGDAHESESARKVLKTEPVGSADPQPE